MALSFRASHARGRAQMQVGNPAGGLLASRWKWQVGFMRGWGADERLTNSDDGAIVVGFAFTTGLGQRIVSFLREPDRQAETPATAGTAGK